MMATDCFQNHRLPSKRGFTLVELMVGLVILAILLAIAVPSMREFIARKRVEGVASELATDLRYLRAKQIERRQNTIIRFSATDEKTCYVLYFESLGVVCDCAKQPACPEPDGRGAAAEELKTVSLPRSSGVVVRASFRPASDPPILLLTGVSGMPFNNVILVASVASSLGGEVRVETNLAARPSICSVSGSSGALPACPSSTP